MAWKQVAAAYEVAWERVQVAKLVVTVAWEPVAKPVAMAAELMEEPMGFMLSNMET